MSTEATAQSGFRVVLAVASLLASAVLPAFAAPGWNAALSSASGAPAIAPAAPVPASGTALVVAAGLGRFALSDAQLSRIRGGFALPNGINLNFGFQQITTINGTIVQSILVPELTRLAGQIPVYVIGSSVLIGSGSTVPGASSSTTSDTLKTAVSPQTTTVSYLETTGATRNGGSGPPTNVSNTQATASPGNPAAAGTEYSVPASSAITVSTGLTDPTGNVAATIQTTLGANGVSSSINNALSNEVIQQVTQMNISVSGLAASVTAAQAVSRVLNAVTQGVKVP